MVKTKAALMWALIGLLMTLGAPAMAQEAAAEEDADAAPAVDAQGAEDEDEDKDEDKDEDEDEDEDKDEDDEPKARESKHGSYAWRLNYGAGLEAGAFFSSLGRWNTQLLTPNNRATFDTDVLLNLDFALEVSPLEGGRFTLFGGVQSPFTDDPSITAMYLGLEPAFAFRRDAWEIALGIGVGVGSVDLSLATSESVNATLLLLRPFVEVRTYPSDWMATYLRFGFNYWNVRDPDFNGLTFQNSLGALNQANLDEGGAYVALGLRFGHYPAPVAVVPDSDGDGIRDDIDDCPDEPEDKDGFQDQDGCPDPDNDGDGIPDDKDQCPNEPEDKDGWKDEDGCPEDDDDPDGDGILGAADKCPTVPGVAAHEGCPVPDSDGDGIPDDRDQCPNEPEDKDGFQDQDGCPDPDNDKDGILDKDDKCPDEAGLPKYQGCPMPDRDGDGIPDDEDKCPDQPETFNGYQDEDGCPDGKPVVVVTETEVRIADQVFFDTNADTIQQKSFTLLDTVANVIIKTPKLTKIRVEGHTDDVGKADYNLDLSKRRAASVRKYLESKGVAADHLESEGYGMTAPVCQDMPELLKNAAKNKKAIEACRAQNRRVGFKILEINGKPVDASTSVIIKEEKVVEQPAPSP